MSDKPIGHVSNEWGGHPEKGYVELHPLPSKTVQIIVNQIDGTIHINGFWKRIEDVASNAITLHF